MSFDRPGVLLTGAGKRYDIVSCFAQLATTVVADPAPLAPAQYAAPPQYAASPQYAAPPQRQAPPQPRQLAPQQRPFVAAVPMPLVPASARAPSSATGRMLARVFSEPGRAADAIILAEILAAPVALRATTSRPWAAL